MVRSWSCWECGQVPIGTGGKEEHVCGRWVGVVMGALEALFHCSYI